MRTWCRPIVTLIWEFHRCAYYCRLADETAAWIDCVKNTCFSPRLSVNQMRKIKMLNSIIHDGVALWDCVGRVGGMQRRALNAPRAHMDKAKKTIAAQRNLFCAATAETECVCVCLIFKSFLDRLIDCCPCNVSCMTKSRSPTAGGRPPGMMINADTESGPHMCQCRWNKLNIYNVAHAVMESEKREKISHMPVNCGEGNIQWNVANRWMYVCISVCLAPVNAMMYLLFTNDLGLVFQCISYKKKPYGIVLTVCLLSSIIHINYRNSTPTSIDLRRNQILRKLRHLFYSSSSIIPNNCT